MLLISTVTNKYFRTSEKLCKDIVLINPKNFDLLQQLEISEYTIVEYYCCACWAQVLLLKENQAHLKPEKER